MEQLKEHIHCKCCGKVIKYDPSFYTLLNYGKADYYDLGICQKCVIKEGIKSLKKKNKK